MSAPCRCFRLSTCFRRLREAARGVERAFHTTFAASLHSQARMPREIRVPKVASAEVKGESVAVASFCQVKQLRVLLKQFDSSMMGSNLQCF